MFNFLETLSAPLAFGIGAGLGFLAGVATGVVAVSMFKNIKYNGQDILAWILAITWIIWHLLAAFTEAVEAPPTMYDIVSGGAVGFIFGEKFFDYVAGSISRMRK